MTVKTKGKKKMTKKIDKVVAESAVNISSLHGTNTKIAVRLVTKDVKERLFNLAGENPERIYQYKFPSDTLLLTKVDNHGLKHCTYLYWHNLSNGSQVHVAVPNDFQVVKLVGEEKEKFDKEYEESIEKNINHALTHYFHSGADPELFVEREDGTILPAFEFLPSKADAKESSPGSSIYWDGFQAEFTTQSFSCLVSFTSGVLQALRHLNAKIKAKDKTARLSIKTVMDIPKHVLASANEEHVNLGCAPSLNIYGMQGKLAEPRTLEFRPAGGHLHFGIGKKDDETIKRIVKALDMVTGVACVSMFAKFDDPRRRELYGLAGEYRLPPHGIEYRTLSNAWIFHPVIMNLVYDLARTAVMLGELNLSKLWKATEEETIKCINTCDVALAREILTRNKTLMIGMLGNRYQGEGMAARAFQIYFEGMESVVKDPSDIVGNWNIDAKKVSVPYHYHNAYRNIVEKKLA